MRPSEFNIVKNTEEFWLYDKTDICNFHILHMSTDEKFPLEIFSYKNLKLSFVICCILNWLFFT